MDRPADNHFRCSECETPCDLYFDGTDEEPVNCSFLCVVKQNWKRVEQSTEGEIMKHVPVIYEKKSGAVEKKWEYDLEINDGLLSVAAVDSKKGSVVAHLFYINTSGVLKLSTCVEQTILGEGYAMQGLAVDCNGRVVLEY